VLVIAKPPLTTPTKDAQDGELASWRHLQHEQLGRTVESLVIAQAPVGSWLPWRADGASHS